MIQETILLENDLSSYLKFRHRVRSVGKQAPCLKVCDFEAEKLL